MFYNPVSRLSSSSSPPFDAFSTCGQASTLDFRNFIRFFFVPKTNIVFSYGVKKAHANTSANRSIRRGQVLE
jgi:hypothetical protein